MRRFITILLCMAALISYCSCTADDLVQDTGIRVYADFSETKTSHSSANGVTTTTWVEGDKIGIFTELQENLCYIADRSGKSTYFSAKKTQIDAKEGEKIYAYYPYSSYGNSGKSFKLPNTQTQWGDLGAATYDVLYAEGTVKNNEIALNFKHAFAYLKILVPTNVLIKDPEDKEYWLRIDSDEAYISLMTSGTYYDRYNLETKEFEFGRTGNACKYILYSIKEEDTIGKEYITCRVAILPQSSKTNINIRVFNGSFAEENILRTVTSPEDGFQAGKVYNININAVQDSDREKTRQALEALYYATNGDQWTNNTNWLSDEPLNTWYGINEDYIFDTGEVYQLILENNNLSGTLPPEFAHILSKAHKIVLSGITGIIPKEVREHPKWQELGWDIIWNKGIDFSEGTGLSIPDGEITFFIEETTKKISNVLNENELTLIWDTRGYEITHDEISNTQVNYFLDYKNKGLGMILTTNAGEWDNRREAILALQEAGLPKEIRWTNDFIGKADGVGRMYLVDKEGNLLGTWGRDYNKSHKWYLDQIDILVRKQLGEPEDHPEFSLEHYTSSDYSRDGEVVTLQTAEMGNGIDIVLMGDAFSDRLIADGTYDEVMMTAYEKFFDEEPYRSLKDHFNVYSVKVVSKNEMYGGETALECYFGDGISEVGGNDQKCFEYALKAIDSQRMNAAVIIVMMNSKTYAGTCYMYYGAEGDYGNGVSISYFPIGTDDEDLAQVLHHEAGGHGFAKLGDEYSYEFNGRITAEIQASYESLGALGWWKNVDFTNDPAQVKWSHFLEDERYADQGLGVYEGGLTYWNGVWRPTKNSIMRHNTDGFNAPSREAIYYRINKLAYGPSWEYDYETFVEFDTASRAGSSAVQKTRANYVKRTYEPTAPPVVINRSWCEEN